jgi:hypothetical protein
MTHHMRPQRGLVVLLLGLLSGCPDPASPPVATSITVVDGVFNRAIPGQQWGPIVVRVAGRDGGGVPGWRVTWSGPGDIAVIDSVTDETGLARAMWTLPRYPIPGGISPTGPSGTYRLSAEALGVGSVAISTIAHAFTARQVDASSDYGCGVGDGRLWCWGAYPALPSVVRWRVPIEIRLPQGVAALSVTAGRRMVCIRDNSRMPWCAARAWGGTFERVAGAPPLLELELQGLAYGDMSVTGCGRSVVDQTPWCWRTTETGMTAASQWITESFGAFAVGRNFACGLAVADGTARCWGSNQYGQLGDGTDQDSDQPVAVADGHRFVSLDASDLGACGGTADGAIYCWGWGPPDPLSRIPHLVTVAGVRGPDFTLGATGEGYVIRGGRLHAWYGNRTHPAFGLTDQLDIVAISSDYQACVRTVTTEVYCSGNMFTGNGDTSIWPSELTAVIDPIEP